MAGGSGQPGGAWPSLLASQSVVTEIASSLYSGLSGETVVTALDGVQGLVRAGDGGQEDVRDLRRHHVVIGADDGQHRVGETGDIIQRM